MLWSLPCIMSSCSRLTYGQLATKYRSKAPATVCSTFSTQASSPTPPSESPPVRWGILSAGKIASDYCQAIRQTPGHEAIAVAARSLDRAKAFAKRHEIPNILTDYADLVASDMVDVVYIGATADHHQALAQLGLRAKKPVVVEKPLTLTYKDTRALVQEAAASKTFLMEGMWTRCFPATLQVQKWIQSGKIGRPLTIQGDFGWSTAGCGPEDRIWYPASGGMTLDIGMYLVQWGRVVFGKDATVTNVQASGTVLNGVDHTVAATVEYEFVDENEDDQAGFLQFALTGAANTEERLIIQGTTGRIIVESPAHVPTAATLELDQGRQVDASQQQQRFEAPLPDDSWASWNYPGSIGFTHQIAAVGEALQAGLTECPHYTWQDSLETAAVLDSIRNQVLEQGTKKKEKLDEHDAEPVAQ